VCCPSQSQGSISVTSKSWTDGSITVLCCAVLCFAMFVLWQTTLMDVLACRKTAGRTEGQVWVSTYHGGLLIAAYV
jgi:hypothetical protein